MRPVVTWSDDTHLARKAMTTTERNWGDDPARAPLPLPGEIIVFDECGRVLSPRSGIGQGVCYRSFYLRLTKHGGSTYAVLVKHGAGQERYPVSSTFGFAVETIGAAMTSDERYALLFSMYRAASDAARSAADAASLELKQAFLEGRMRKKRQVKCGTVTTTVRILDRSAARPLAAG